jgi:hypothetical protein
MPDFHYDGPVSAVLSDEHEGSLPDHLDGSPITEEQAYGEQYMLEHAEESWHECYPESEVIIHHVSHFDYLMDEERSIKPLADYFNGLP